MKHTVDTWIIPSCVGEICYRDAEENSIAQKFIHLNADGSSCEAIICNLPYGVRDGVHENNYSYFVNDQINGGTYNFFDYNVQPIAHTLYDVIPYYIWGN